MPVNPAISLISQLRSDFRIMAIQPLISFLYMLPVRLDHGIFFGVDKTTVKKKFPQPIGIDFIGNMDAGIQNVHHDMAQPVIGDDLHIQNDKTVAEEILSSPSAVEDLCCARYGHCA